jgi:hypothetical protein
MLRISPYLPLPINFRKKYPNLSLNRFNIASGHGDWNV